MYLVRIETEQGVLRQGVARIRWPRSDHPAAQRFEIWRRRCVRVCATIPTLSSYAALEIEADGETSSLFAFLVRDEDVNLARTAVATLVRIEGYGDAEVNLPEAPDAYLSRFARLEPAYDRMALHAADAAAPDGSPLWAPTTLFDLLPDITSLTSRLGVSLVYESASVNLRPDAAMLREELVGLSRLEDAQGAPGDVIEMRRGAVARMRESQRHCVESLIAPATIAPMVEGLLRSDPDWSVAALHNFSSRLAQVDEDEAAALSYLTHPTTMGAEAGALNPAGFIRESGYIDRLSLTGVRELDEADQSYASSPTTPTTPVSPRPADGAYLFLSYAHADWPGLAPLITTLRETGVRIWMDEQMHGGEEWDAQIERQIVESAGLLAMVSDAYVSSKWCKRELKFADALDKPLIGVRLGNAEFSDGLGMIFASLQYVEMADPSVVPAILNAVSEVAASAATPVARN